MSLKTDLRSWVDNRVIGELDLSSSVFDIEVKPYVLSEVVRWQLAKRRLGTHKTKTKGLVRGGGKKPFKQKGTGNARQGSIRSPLMPGGGKVFGPVPRKYDYNLAKNFRKNALKMALTQALKEMRFYVYDSIETNGKTNPIAKKLVQFGFNKALFLGKDAHLLERAVRNLPAIKYLDVVGLNVYDVLKYQTILISKDDLKTLEQKLGGV